VVRLFEVRMRNKTNALTAGSEVDAVRYINGKLVRVFRVN
jgi:hypothetical protein